jgi:hypothetical protein
VESVRAEDIAAFAQPPGFLYEGRVASPSSEATKRRLAICERLAVRVFHDGELVALSG